MKSNLIYFILNHNIKFFKLKKKFIEIKKPNNIMIDNNK